MYLAQGRFWLRKLDKIENLWQKDFKITTLISQKLGEGTRISSQPL